MNDEHHNLLLDAVDLLTKERIVHTTITDEETGEWLRVHSEEHPPLLTLLIEGTGITRGAASSAIRIPIDADALELYSQISDLAKLWCKKLGAVWAGDDLLISIRRWYLAHHNAVAAGVVSEVVDHDVTRMVQGWVRMIETKFEPPEKREWKEPCPAYIEDRNEEGEVTGHHRCGARRIVENGEERFAIILNVTALTAECGSCKCKWEGKTGFAMLRYETNLRNAEKAEADTPTPQSA